ncbi:hypothetical protein CLOM_g21571 [Closterium sp. NIES-68]|nr:hypothetical protein CLOM_g21571 [Closterium sp. NIES-68]GJP71376.1 hypothetical protein CLOP_g2212 [Closterium sp. NIES-67]
MVASLLASALFLLSSLISAILFSPHSPPVLLALPGEVRRIFLPALVPTRAGISGGWVGGRQRLGLPSFIITADGAHPSLRMIPPAQSDLPAEAILEQVVSGAAYSVPTEQAEGFRRGAGIVLPAEGATSGGEREQQERKKAAQLQEQKEQAEKEWHAAVERTVEEAVSDAFGQAQFLLASLGSVRRAARAAQKAFSDRSFISIVEEEMTVHFGGEGEEGEKRVRGTEVSVRGRVREEARRRADAVVRTVVVMLSERGEEGVESAGMGAEGEEEEGEDGQEGGEGEGGGKETEAAGGGAAGRRYRLAQRLKGLGDVARDKVWDMADLFLSQLRAAGQKVISAEEFLAARVRYAAARVKDAGKRVVERVVESGRAAREDAEAARDTVIATGRAAKEKVEAVGEAAWEKAHGAGQAAVDTTVGFCYRAAEFGQEAVDRCRQAGQTVWEGGKKTVGAVKGGVQGAVKGVREGVEGVVEGVGEAVEDVSGRVKGVGKCVVEEGLRRHTHGEAHAPAPPDSAAPSAFLGPVYDVAREAVQMEHGGGDEAQGAEKVQESAEKVQESAEKVQESAEKVQESAEKVQESAEKVQESAEKVQESAEKVQESAEKVQESAGTSWEEARETGSKAGEEVKEGAEKVWEEARERVGEGWEELREKVGGFGEGLKGEAEGVKAGVKEKAEGVGEGIVEAVEGVKEGARGKAEEVRRGVRESGEKGWEAVEGIGEKIAEGMRRAGGDGEGRGEGVREVEEEEMGNEVWMEVEGVRFYRSVRPKAGSKGGVERAEKEWGEWEMVKPPFPASALMSRLPLWFQRLVLPVPLVSHLSSLPSSPPLLVPALIRTAHLAAFSLTYTLTLCFTFLPLGQLRNLFSARSSAQMASLIELTFLRVLLATSALCLLSLSLAHSHTPLSPLRTSSSPPPAAWGAGGEDDGGGGGEGEAWAERAGGVGAEGEGEGMGGWAAAAGGMGGGVGDCGDELQLWLLAAVTVLAALLALILQPLLSYNMEDLAALSQSPSLPTPRHKRPRSWLLRRHKALHPTAPAAPATPPQTPPAPAPAPVEGTGEGPLSPAASAAALAATVTEPTAAAVSSLVTEGAARVAQEMGATSAAAARPAQESEGVEGRGEEGVGREEVQQRQQLLQWRVRVLTVLKSVVTHALLAVLTWHLWHLACCVLV